MKFSDIDLAIEAMSMGRIVILVDHHDRENEGDFVQVAECVSPESVNFMITHGRGLLCQTITSKRAKELRLDLQVQENTSLHETAFTVSVDFLHGTTTGISVFDRAKTIKAVADDNTKPEDLGRPGHVFPIVAHDGGVFARPGHTEGSVLMAQLAGKKPNALICEILNNEGRAASYEEMKVFAAQHDLMIISIDDLVAYMKEKNTQ